MTVLLGAAPSIIGPSEVGAWMAAKGAAGAAALLDFAGGKYGFCNAAGVPRWGSVAGDMVFARASAAGRWRADGIYEMAGSGVLRYDHDPVTREPLGVRIESAVTPLSVNTTNIAAWPGVTASQINRPSMFAGGVAVEHVAPSSGYRSQQYTLAANTNFRIDAIVERGVGTDAPPHFMMGFYRNTPGWISSCYFYWTGTFSAGPGALASSGHIIENLGIGPNGGQMFRFSCVVQSGDGGSTGFFFYPTATWGSVAGQSAIVHYACVTAGAAYTSPLVTGASAVTRAAERLTLTLPFDASEHGITLVTKGVMPRWINPSGSHLLCFGTPTLVPRIVTYAFGSFVISTAALGSPTLFNPPLSLTLSAGLPIRAVVSATPAGDYRLSTNGGAVSARAGNAMPAGSTFLDIGNLSGPYAWGGTIEKIAIWRGTPFNDAALQGLLA